MISITTINNFAPLTNKAGKITATAEKRAILLNALDSKGILSVALNGKGAMRSQAAMSLQADSIFSLIWSPVALSGEQIGTLRALLIGEYGEASFNRETMKGLNGMAAYLSAVRLMLDHRFVIAETVKAQDNAIKSLDTLTARQNCLNDLIALRDEAIVASNPVVVTEVAPEVAPEVVTEVVAEVAPEVVAEVVAEVVVKKGKRKAVTS